MAGPFNPRMWFTGGTRSTSATEEKDVNNSQDTNKDDPQNNNGNNTQVKSFWETPKQQDDKNSRDNNNNNTNNNTNNQINPEDEVKKFFEKFQFVNPVDLSQLEEAVRQNDFSKVQMNFDEFGRSVMQQTMGQMSKFVETKVREAVDEAVKTTRNSVKADKIVEEMERTLPFTANPNLSPIAKTVLRKAIENGAPDNQSAIEVVKEFFKEANTLSSADLGLDNLPPTGRRPFGARGKEQPDWLKILKGLAD